MSVLNRANVNKARSHLATMAGVLKSVASGDNAGAIQTLESIVGQDEDQFEDLLDSQETLASLLALASDSLEEGDEGEEDEDEYEDDEDEEEEIATASVTSPKAQRKRMKQRAAFLGIAQAGFDDEDEEEDFDDSEEDEDEQDEATANVDEDEDFEDDEDESEDYESEDESEDDEEDESEDDVVTAKFKKKLAQRKVAKASVAAPKAKVKASTKKRSDGRL